MACIELIGCTSAGKSTLASLILQFCRDEGFDVSLGEDFLLDQFHLGQVGNFTARALLVNIISLPVALSNWGKYRHFYSFSFRTITHLQIPWREKVYLVRNILKSIGIYEIAHTRADSCQVILLDEGPLHSANALFVHVAAAPPEGELSEFVRVVPFPDAAVYLREREEVLIRRTIARGHKRIQNGNRSEVEQFVQSAIAMFERLSQEPLVQSKLLIVNNRQVTLPQSDSGSPLQKFILNIIRACLDDPSVDTGIAIKPFHLELLQSRAEIGALCEDKS
jgi:hypothetical protein